MTHTHRNQTLWLCTALHACTHIYQVALIPLYLLIRKDLGLSSDWKATIMVSIMAAAYFLPSYAMGVLADRINRKALLFWGLLINAAGFIWLALSRDYSSAIAALIVAGLGGSCFHPAATALVANLFPDQTGKALGRVGIGAGVGFFIGPIYAGWRAAAAGWRAPVLELGIAGIVAAFLFLFLARPDGDRSPASRSKMSPQKLFSAPAVALIFLLASFMFSLRDFAGSGIATLASLFLQKAHHLTPGQTGWVISCIFLGSIAGNPFFGKLSDQRRLGVGAAVLSVAAVLVLAVPFVPVMAVIVLFGVYGFFFMSSYPIVEAALMESFEPAIRGRIFGLFITIGGLLGNGAHAVMGGWVGSLGVRATESRGYAPIFGALALFIVLSIGGLFCLQRLKGERANNTKLSPLPA